MNNETKIGLVKEWDSPRSNVQLFVPQEYCGNCYVEYNQYGPLSGYSANIIFDYTNFGIYDTGERFTSSGGGGTAGRYSNVKAYYITYKGQSALYTGTPPNGASLGNNVDVKIGKNTYTFHQISGSFDIEIQQKGYGTKAYVKATNAS